jgi:hypothetical protein
VIGPSLTLRTPKLLERKAAGNYLVGQILAARGGEGWAFQGESRRGVAAW